MLLSRKYWHPSTPSGSRTSSALSRCYWSIFDLPNKPATEHHLLWSYSQIHRRGVKRVSEKRHGYSQGETFTGTYGMERFFFCIDSFATWFIYSPPDSFLTHLMIHFPLTESDILLRHMFVNVVHWLDPEHLGPTGLLDFCKYANKVIQFKLKVSLFYVTC